MIINEIIPAIKNVNELYKNPKNMLNDMMIPAIILDIDLIPYINEWFNALPFEIKWVMSGNIELFVFLNRSIVNILNTAIIINRYKLKPIIFV